VANQPSEAGSFEVVPTKNVSRFGIQMVAQEFWSQPTWYSFHPRLDLHPRLGRVLQEAPSEDYILGIRLTRQWRSGWSNSDSGVLSDLSLNQGVKECSAFMSPKAVALRG